MIPKNLVIFKMESTKELEIPKVCVFGETGHGKSFTCNHLIGATPGEGSEEFKTSSQVDSCTYETKAVEKYFMGKEEYGKFWIIDTPGYGDPAGDFENT